MKLMWKIQFQIKNIKKNFCGIHTFHFEIIYLWFCVRFTQSKWSEVNKKNEHETWFSNDLTLFFLLFVVRYRKHDTKYIPWNSFFILLYFSLIKQMRHNFFTCLERNVVRFLIKSVSHFIESYMKMIYILNATCLFLSFSQY